jgi:competence protein ComFC
MLIKILPRLARVIFPDRCAVCGYPQDPFKGSDLPLCERCSNLPLELGGERCCVCGIPLVSESRICTRCRDREYEFTRAVSLYAYADAAKHILTLYKFRKRKRLSRFFAERVATLLEREFPGVPVVPVPGRPQSVKKRGWDQVWEVCRVLRKEHGLQVYRMLTRTRKGKSQKELSYEHRIVNLKKSFRFRKPGRGEIPETVVVLDDVFTTGATCSECAKILRAGGIRKVCVVTICIDL